MGSQMASGKKPKSHKKKPVRYWAGDHFGLEGREISRSSIVKREIPSWFKEISDKLRGRWEVVEEYERDESLQRRLSRKFGRTVSPREAEQWFQNAMRDHLWR